MGLLNDPLTINVFKCFDKLQYEIKRSIFVTDSNGYMGHYYVPEKTHGGMQTFWKVQCFTLTAHQMLMTIHSNMNLILFPLSSYLSKHKRSLKLLILKIGGTKSWKQ